MGGKKRKSRCTRSQSSQNNHHLNIDSATGRLDEKHGATDLSNMAARKLGKRGVAQRMKRQKDFQIIPNSDIDFIRSPERSQDRSLRQGKKKKLQCHYIINDVSTEGEEEDISEYITAEEGDNEENAEEILKPKEKLLVASFLFEEDNPQKDDAGNQDSVNSETQKILRQLQELLNAREEDVVSLPMGSVESSAGESITSKNESGFGVSTLSDSSESNTCVDAAIVDHDGQGEDKSSQDSACKESATSYVSKSSSMQFGFGLRSVFSRLKPFKSQPQRVVEEENIPRPQSGSVSKIQKAAANVQPAEPRKELRRQKWSEKFAKRFELSSMGYYFDGDIIDHKMNGYGRLVLRNYEYIAGIWDANQLIDLMSCQLFHCGRTYNIVKRRDDYLLTIYETLFVALVNLNSIYELDFTKSIGQLKESFFKKLDVLVVFQDELTERRKDSLNEFKMLFENMTGEHADPVIRANTFVVLRKYSSKTLNKRLSDFLNDPNVHPILKTAAIRLQTHDAEYCSLNNSITFLKKNVVQLDLMAIMMNIYNDRIEHHKKMLISRCPNSLPDLKSELGNLDNSKITYITRADIDVFDQLASQSFFQHYEGCVKNLVERFVQAFEKVLAYSHPPISFDDFSTTPPTAIIPIMSPTLEFLTRSICEIISEIIEAAGEYEYEYLLKCNSGHWEIQEEIKWSREQDCTDEHETVSSCKPSENKCYYLRALEIQYKLIFGILKQVLPDNYILNKRLTYKFCVLGQDSSQNDGIPGPTVDMMPGLQMSNGLPERFKDLSEERLVWLYILDQTIHEVFKDDPLYPHVLKQNDPLLQGAVRFVENSPTESQESFRAMIHNVLKFVMSFAPLIKVTSEQLDVDVEEEKLGINVEILFEQISTACRSIVNDQLAFSNFKDLITEYNKYLSLRHSIGMKAAPGYFSVQLSQMMQTFMCVVETSLKKSVPTDALVSYFRCLNDFVDDFRNIDFLGLWYIKTMGFDNQKAMKKVDNKLSTGKNCSYLVTDIELFVAEYQCLDRPPPHHYIIQIVHELLICIGKCLEKQWQSDDNHLQVVQLKTAGILLDATRRSFMYLKEQPDYVDFKAFKKESVGPFARLVDECSTLNDLKNRANIVKESFWYLRKMDEIDIDQAMILLRDVNTCEISDKLLNCYNLYLSSYNEYIEKYTSLISSGNTQADGLNAVEQMLKKVCPLHFSKWTEKFKIEEIPILLAGLSAVWSILVSKDLSGTGKFLKPHCIQILCILRLLSVDESPGTNNHLAQVLTGQGKSVILGLLSTILALTGHNVRVLCYSEYLSSRDLHDFKDLFQRFQIYNKINYGTFEGMANEFLEPTCDGRRISLRQLVEDRVRTHANWSEMGTVTKESENAVLLIDEVDVFFTEYFYGNTYNPCVLVRFKGLAVLQEKIWSLATTKTFTCQQIVDQTKAFISDAAAARNSLLLDLNLFLSEPGTFSLLRDEGEYLRVKYYTNQSLFDEHLFQMIITAISVATRSKTDRQYMIDSSGMILARSNEIYDESWCRSSYYGYYNIFNYFRLKGSDYDHKYCQNYGYLLLGAGEISYSQIPSHFQLILGVSGTIKNLSEYEKAGIKSYDINNTTILPSFYGESNLNFNKEQDFHYCADNQEWLKKIYTEANKALQMSRAVLIFFESNRAIDLFTQEYRSKFDRLNELSMDTQDHLRDKYIEEAGLPGAVTLSTRVMGRGVDYKSSLSVEKHGGVHVIQTFYSIDIKEEIQIKGRTARKDNKGSYVMMICRDHLVEENIISASDLTIHNYESLDEIRQKLSAEKGRNVMDKIIRSEQDHETTMKYFGLG